MAFRKCNPSSLRIPITHVLFLHFQVSGVFQESNYNSHVQRYSHMSFPWLIPPKAKRFFNNPDSFWSVMMVSLLFILVKLQTIHLYKLGAAIVLKYSGRAMWFGPVLGQHLWQLSRLAWKNNNVNLYVLKGIKIA